MNTSRQDGLPTVGCSQLRYLCSESNSTCSLQACATEDEAAPVQKGKNVLLVVQAETVLKESGIYRNSLGVLGLCDTRAPRHGGVH